MMPWKGFVAKIEEFRLQRLESARQIDRCSVQFAETLMNKKVRESLKASNQAFLDLKAVSRGIRIHASWNGAFGGILIVCVFAVVLKVTGVLDWGFSFFQ